MSRPLYSDRQINIIREAGQIIARCFDIIRKEAKPGVTTQYLDQLIADQIAKDGGISAFLGYSYGQQKPFPATICTSLNEVIVHGVPDETPMVEGDLLSADIGVLKNFYYADAAWTFPIGEVDDAAKKLLQVGESALNAGIAAFQKGAKLISISKAVQELTEANKFTIVREFVGHGVGHHLHEAPQVRNYIDESYPEGESVILKPGTVIAIEPMINEKQRMIKYSANEWPVRTADGARSVHFEHTVAMMSDGKVEILTK